MVSIDEKIAAIKKAIKRKKIGKTFRDRLTLVFYRYADKTLTVGDKTVIRRAYNGIEAIEEYEDGDDVGY